MGVILRYVNREGLVVERFLCVAHVVETTSLVLKTQIKKILATWGLNISRVRGQGYDGASNMRGELHELQKLILDENPSAHYVHCFAHQLQLALVKATRSCKRVKLFIDDLLSLVNIIGGSCKRRELLREEKLKEIAKGVESGEIKTGTRLNQEETQHRRGDTCWNSHYSSIVGLISLFSPIRELLKVISKWDKDDNNTYAHYMFYKIDNFEFVFVFNMMNKLLGITHELSLALQIKDKDIINALNLVKMAKQRLNLMRDDDTFKKLWIAACEFCKKHNIEAPKLEHDYVPIGRSKCGEKKSNTYHFKVKIYFSAIDYQYKKLNVHFNDRNCKLLSCLSTFDPRNFFARYDKEKLLELARFYTLDFSQ